MFMHNFHAPIICCDYHTNNLLQRRRCSTLIQSKCSKYQKIFYQFNHFCNTISLNIHCKYRKPMKPMEKIYGKSINLQKYTDL